MAKKSDQYSEAEAQRRFEQALKGAAKVAPKKASPAKAAKRGKKAADKR